MAASQPLEDNIQIVHYDPIWVKRAEEEILVLKRILDKNWIVDIQHIGSTAVPGLAAKPIVDIYIGATGMEKAQAAIQPLEKLGYQYWADNPNPEKMFFVKGMPPLGKGRTHHIHIVKHDSSYWRAKLVFRDYLRFHPIEANQYAQLKLKLAQEYTADREAYTDAKSDFIASILQKAGFKEKVKR